MESQVEELEKTLELCQKIDFSPGNARFASDLLEPSACLLDAETAVFRVFSRGEPKPAALIGLGIPDCVHDDYLAHFFKLDPTQRLLRRCIAEPVFADQARPGQWSDEKTATVKKSCCMPQQTVLPRHLHEFHRFRKEFLLPNNFYHHVGIRFQDASGKYTFALDYNRPEKLPSFGRLEVARAKVVTMLFHARAVQLSSLVNQDEPNPRFSACHHERSNDEESLLPDTDKTGFTDIPGLQLSTRELEVAETVALGLTNKEVSETLNISVRTVENHIRSIFAKLNVNTRTRLAAKLHEVRL